MIMYSAAGGIIAENSGEPETADGFSIPRSLFSLPLKLVGCDGSPVRAVAIDFY